MTRAPPEVVDTATAAEFVLAAEKLVSVLADESAAAAVCTADAFDVRVARFAICDWTAL